MHSVILTEFILQTIYFMEFSKQICFMICKNLLMRGFVAISRNTSIESMVEMLAVNNTTTHAISAFALAGTTVGGCYRT